MKVRLMIIIGVISFLLGGCNKIQKNSNQVQLVQRTEEILVESEDLADDYFHIYKERWMYIPFRVNHLHGQTEPVPRRMRATLTETEPVLFDVNYQTTVC